MKYSIIIILILTSARAHIDKEKAYRCYKEIGPVYLGIYPSQYEAEKEIVEDAWKNNDIFFKDKSYKYKCYPYKIIEER